jgi:hypothetical protein
MIERAASTSRANSSATTSFEIRHPTDRRR